MNDYLRAGDTERITREYFDSLLLEMRHIDSTTPSTEMELYGHTFKTPVMLAALSHLNKTHPEGLVEAARGVRDAGAVMWAGMGDEQELTDIVATGAKTINIIKPYADREMLIRRIQHAEKVGAIAVGIDVDHQFGSQGRRKFILEDEMAPQSLADIKELVACTKLPFVIKGVLSERDAHKCVEAGVRGIVVSHHHGMVDYALPPLQILPKIAKIVNRKFPIFVDCAIMRGLDAFKAIALGATAVSVGRAAMPPLGEQGAAGVTKLFNSMTNELDWAMCVTCCPTLAHIEPTILHKRI